MFAPKIPVKSASSVIQAQLTNYLAHRKIIWEKFNKATGKVEITAKEPYPTCEDEYLNQKSLEHALKN